MRDLAKVVFLLISGWTVVACNEDELSTGAQFVDGVSFEFISWDTLTMEFSTVKLDSFSTTSPNRLAIGGLQHEVYGNVNAAGYLQLTPDSTGFYFDDQDHQFDSITVIITYDNYFLNDTTSDYTLVIEEVIEDIELNEETAYLYNTSTFKVKPAPLGRLTFKPRPYTGTSVEVRIDDELGERFFNEGLTSNNIFYSATDFIEEFKGIKISAESDANAIIGFEVTPELRLYYTDHSVIPSEQSHISFTNQNLTEIYFNHFDADYSGTALASLAKGDTTSLPSKSSDKLAFMQSGVGLAIRIEMPYLKKIVEDNPNLLIEDVTLKLRPVNNQYESDFELPEALLLYYVNGKNEVISSYASSMNLTLDDEFDIDTYYAFNIIDFLEYQLEQEENNENALMILSTQDGFSNSLHYVQVGDQDNKDYRAEINLNLIQLKNE